MSLYWLTDPVLLVVNILAAYRLSVLLIDDTIPPLPALRARVERWAERRWDSELHAAMRADRDTPEHMAAVDEAGKRALAGGYNATHVAGPREQAIYDKRRPYEEHPAITFIGCYWCLGFWVSLTVAALASTGPWWTWVAAPLALSAAVATLAHTAK